MTIDEARARVYEIGNKWLSTDDDEACHGMEDDLREDVLKVIAAGSSDAAELAKIALETSGFGFARRCA